VDVLFVVWVGLGVLAGGLRAGFRVWLSEQSGFGLDEDAAADQALEPGADVLGVLGRDRQGLLRDQQRHAGASPLGDEPAAIRMEKAHWLPAVVLRLPAERPTLIDSITWGTARTPIYFPNI
jgi:hypothetical protein